MGGEMIKQLKSKLYTVPNSKESNTTFGLLNEIDFLSKLNFEQFIVMPSKNIEFNSHEESVIICMYGSGSCIIGKKNNSLRRDDLYCIGSNNYLKVFNNSESEHMCFVKITSKDQA